MENPQPGSGQGGMENGEWKMENSPKTTSGQVGMENGEWKMENPQAGRSRERERQASHLLAMAPALAAGAFYE